MSKNTEQLAADATRLLRAGAIDDALDAHRRLLAVDPDRPDSWYNLAYLQRCARRFDDALASYRQALDRGIRAPEEILVNRAAILSEHLERGGDAETELKAAIAINPRFTLAWLNLGNLYEDRGDAAKARAAYGKALEISPLDGRALARLAAIDLFEGEPERVIARLQPVSKTAGLPAADAAEVSFALGHALDAIGAYDAAFASFAHANHAGQAAAPEMRYDPAAQERLIEDLIAAFPGVAPTPAAGDGRPPIFICGMFRSGSTLAEQILARHSLVTPGGELEFLPALVATELQPYPQSLASLREQHMAALRARYMAELRSIYPAADIVTDKRPDNFLHIGLIKGLFPDARIVHTRRHPLDNLLSIYFLYFNDSVRYGFDLDHIAHAYGQYRRLMAHWKALYPNDIHDFDYDDVVRQPRPAIEDLIRFCGLAWEENCLTAQARDTVRTASVWQVRQPLHARSSGRWKNYEAHLARVQAALKVTG